MPTNLRSKPGWGLHRLALLCLSASACVTIGDCDIFEDECVVDSDCYDGLVCVAADFNTICTYPDRCTSDADCSGNDVCVSIPSDDPNNPFEADEAARLACRPGPPPGGGTSDGGSTGEAAGSPDGGSTGEAAGNPGGGNAGGAGGQSAGGGGT